MLLVLLVLLELLLAYPALLWARVAVEREKGRELRARSLSRRRVSVGQLLLLLLLLLLPLMPNIAAAVGSR